MHLLVCELRRFQNERCSDKKNSNHIFKTRLACCNTINMYISWKLSEINFQTQNFLIAPAMKTTIFSLRCGYQNVLAVSYSNMLSFLVSKKSVGKSKPPSP